MPRETIVSGATISSVSRQLRSSTENCVFITYEDRVICPVGHLSGIATVGDVLSRFGIGRSWLTGVSLAARVSRAAVLDAENTYRVRSYGL